MDTRYRIYFKFPYIRDDSLLTATLKKIQFSRDLTDPSILIPLYKNKLGIVSGDIVHDPIFLPFWIEQKDYDRLHNGVALKYVKSGTIESSVAEHINSKIKKEKHFNIYWEDRKVDFKDLTNVEKYYPIKSDFLNYALVCTPEYNILFVHSRVFTRRRDTRKLHQKDGIFLFEETIFSSDVNVKISTLANSQGLHTHSFQKTLVVSMTGFARLTGFYQINKWDVCIEYYSDLYKDILKIYRVTEIQESGAILDLLFICKNGYWDTPNVPDSYKNLWHMFHNAQFPQQKDFDKSAWDYLH